MRRLGGQLTRDGEIMNATYRGPDQIPRWAPSSLKETRSAGAITQQIAGIRDLLKLSLFGGGILSRLFPRVSLAKSTSALLRFG